MTESQHATTAQEISEKVLACIAAGQEAQEGDADAVARAVAALTPLLVLQVQECCIDTNPICTYMLTCFYVFTSYCVFVLL
jgi:hypothetical protein